MRTPAARLPRAERRGARLRAGGRRGARRGARARGRRMARGAPALAPACGAASPSACASTGARWRRAVKPRWCPSSAPTPLAERARHARAGDRPARHPRTPLAAGLGGRVERRGRHRAPPRRPSHEHPPARLRHCRRRRAGPRSPRMARGTRSAEQRRRAAAALAPRLGLAAVLALSAVLNTHRLAQNGYANVYYSAGVKSMLGSLARLPLRLLRSGGPDEHRQAPSGTVGAGRERQAVWLLCRSACCCPRRSRACSPWQLSTGR